LVQLHSYMCIAQKRHPARLSQYQYQYPLLITTILITIAIIIIIQLLLLIRAGVSVKLLKFGDGFLGRGLRSSAI